MDEGELKQRELEAVCRREQASPEFRRALQAEMRLVRRIEPARYKMLRYGD